jgi:hypothetical protein
MPSPSLSHESIVALFLVLTLSTYIFGVLSGLYARRLIYRRQYRAQRKTARVDAALDSSINAKLAHVRQVCDADKAKIYQLSTTGIGRVKKMSLTHLVLKPGIEMPNVSALQNLPTALTPNMLNQLLTNHGIIYWEGDQAPDSFLRAKHKGERITAVMICGVYDKETRGLLGFIGLNWVDRKPVKIDEAKLLRLASDLSVIF